MKNEHMVPVMVKQMVESYLKTKAGSQERAAIEARLIATKDFINAGLKK